MLIVSQRVWLAKLDLPDLRDLRDRKDRRVPREIRALPASRATRVRGARTVDTECQAKTARKVNEEKWECLDRRDKPCVERANQYY